VRRAREDVGAQGILDEAEDVAQTVEAVVGARGILERDGDGARARHRVAVAAAARGGFPRDEDEPRMGRSFMGALGAGGLARGLARDEGGAKSIRGLTAAPWVAVLLALYDEGASTLV
jgi:hypothetical protein